MRRIRSKTHEAADTPRRDPARGEDPGDPYELRAKLPDPTACPRCGALYRDGRWTWGAAPADAHRTECPACRRAEERVPAAIVTVDGEFAAAHRDEIRSLVRHVEEREKALHALKRIMTMDERDDGALAIETTDAKLARAIGQALHRAYRGTLDYQFVEADSCFRVRWTR
jgi:NMD protein affecting ribosome stability and mRNA decay